VLNLGISGSEYASHLLEVARSMHARRTGWVPAQAIVRRSSLERRVAAMLNARLNRAPLSRVGRLSAALALVVVTIFVAGFSAAQTSPALSGTVTDQLGAPLANTTVALVDLTTNAKSEAKTDSTGRYEFARIAPGDYMMAIAAVGFQPFQQRVVVTSAPVERSVRMKLGRIQESVTITDGPPSAPSKPAPSREDMQRKIAAMLRVRTCGEPGGCIVPPIKVADKKPVYPDTYDGPGEAVVLTAIIDATGHVTNLEPVGTPNAALAQAAINAVSQWEFEPTRLDGQVVDTEMTVTVNFKSSR
jgi:TonB family protein